MGHDKKFSWAFVAVIIFSASFFSSSSGQKFSSQERDKLPLADASLPPPSDTKERTLRRIRNSRYDLPDKSVDPGLFELTDKSPEVLLSLADSHPMRRPAFPLSEADTIVVGELKSSSAYLSNDHTSVYSEFCVLLEQIVKSNVELEIGQNVVVEQAGGRVRLRSGKELLRGASYGRGVPQIGGRYVFFLRADTEADAFSLTTAYELKSGKIFPLDRSPASDKPSPEFAEYERYVGATETVFFRDLFLAIKSISRLQTPGQGQ